MDSRLGEIDLIRWHAAGRNRRAHGVRLPTLILLGLELLGGLVCLSHLSGLTPLGEAFPLIPVILIAPAASTQLFTALKLSLRWLAS